MFFLIHLFKIQIAHRTWLIFVSIICLLILSRGVITLISDRQRKNAKSIQSNYEVYSKQQLTQLSDYYTNLPTNSNLYLPIGQWTGRLIAPLKEQRQADDSVLFEVHHADANHQQLIGRIVNLRWSEAAQVRAFVRTVTRDVNFTQQTKNSQKQGIVHPERLNQLESVGPLESLAGARPQDDVLVMLQPVVIDADRGNRPSLIVEREPVQITGSIYALVTIIERQASSDRFLVRHFNRNSKQFDGPSEIIRIPQVPNDRRGVPRSTNWGIEQSPLNPTGWYMYGTKGADGVFVTLAIAPRAIFLVRSLLFTPVPTEVYLGLKSAIAYINQQHWKNTKLQKGTAKTVLLDPAAKQAKDAISRWQEGDRAIVMHTFGGIGGRKAEPSYLGLVPGHFSYGMARVLRDSFTQELRFDIEYQQVYAHNSDGIVAGAIQWPSYMGDLQRGWLGNRPVSDIIVKLDAITQNYDFDGIKLSPMAELTQQLDIMTARYRIGNGTGAAVVSPAASCVQDSSQALYVTIKQIEDRVASHPQIQDWLHRHPHNPQTKRFQQLVALGRSLERTLAPLGIVRPDWRHNAEKPLGIGTSNPIGTLFEGLASWRTVLPRRAQDEIATILLQHGASLWVIRTNQVGGFDPEIEPLAPTALLGHRVG